MIWSGTGRRGGLLAADAYGLFVRADRCRTTSRFVPLTHDRLRRLPPTSVDGDVGVRCETGARLVLHFRARIGRVTRYIRPSRSYLARGETRWVTVVARLESARDPLALVSLDRSGRRVRLFAQRRCDAA